MEFHKSTAFSWTHTISTSLHVPHPLLVRTHLSFSSSYQNFSCLPPIFCLQNCLCLCGFQRFQTKSLRVWCASDQAKVCSSELECVCIRNVVEFQITLTMISITILFKQWVSCDWYIGSSVNGVILRFLVMHFGISFTTPFYCGVNLCLSLLFCIIIIMIASHFMEIY